MCYDFLNGLAPLAGLSFPPSFLPPSQRAPLIYQLLRMAAAGPVSFPRPAFVVDTGTRSVGAALDSDYGNGAVGNLSATAAAVKIGE